MNIFVLDRNPVKAAEYHCDRHMKMCLESAQMLCTVANKYGRRSGYRSTHVNHPQTLWVGSTISNMEWLVSLLDALNKENVKRFGKVHASHVVGMKAADYLANKLPKGKLEPFVLTMPDAYKVEDPVLSYRRFYMGHKKGFAEWRLGAPSWWRPMVRRRD